MRYIEDVVFSDGSTTLAFIISALVTSPLNRIFFCLQSLQMY